MRALPDMRRRMTLKQRKTAACTAGDTGTVRRHSDNRSNRIIGLRQKHNK